MPSIMSFYSQRHTQRSQVKGTQSLLGRSKQSESLQIQDERSHVHKQKLKVIRDHLAALIKMRFQMLGKLHNKFGFNTTKPSSMTFILMTGGWM